MAGTITTSTIQNDTSSPPTFRNNSVEIGTLCRAWVNFNGTGTVAIRASFNVSSITDNGTGLYTVNFTNAFADANYSVSLGADAQSGSNRGIGMTSTYSASSVQVSNEDKSVSFGGGRQDTSTVCVSIFR
jgi:hypothetical protein